MKSFYFKAHKNSHRLPQSPFHTFDKTRTQAASEKRDRGDRLPLGPAIKGGQHLPALKNTDHFGKIAVRTIFFDHLGRAQVAKNRGYHGHHTHMLIDDLDLDHLVITVLKFSNIDAC